MSEPHPFAGWRNRRWWQARFGRAGGLVVREIRLLVVVLVIVLLVWAFMEIADEVIEGETQSIDERIIRSLRRPDDAAVPIGPDWLRGVALDLTALGSAIVLILVSGLVSGFLLLQRKIRYTLLVVVALAGGQLLNSGLKRFFDRDRPDIVPHLREVMTSSFPSGHAAMSAVVYLTLGVMLMETLKGRSSKLYVLGVALLLTFLVGLSRVYLGVHYPSDVLAGWVTGLAWSLACWVTAHLLHRRRTSRLGRELDT